MTDNEIIKALECHVGKMDCDSCPYGAEHGAYCIKVLHRHSLEIITRQKAEIEALKQIEHVTAPKLHPMGAQTMAIACSLCKYHGEDKYEFERCNKCMCEVESGFEYDPNVKIVRANED